MKYSAKRKGMKERKICLKEKQKKERKKKKEKRT